MDSTNHNVLQLVSAAAQVLESQDGTDLADDRSGSLSVSERQRCEEIKVLLAEATGGRVESDTSKDQQHIELSSKVEDEEQGNMKERSKEERLQLIFGLPTTEKLYGAWPCCIVRSAIVPGALYLTENRICFYASLPQNELAYRKSGYLELRTSGTMAIGFERFYFELKNDNLAWYESATDMYSPKGKIDLKDVLAVKQSKRREYGFKLVAMEKTLHFQADTKAALIEWTNVFQKAIFKAKSSGNSLKISLPFGNIVDIEQTEAFEFQQYVQIRAVGVDDSFVLDEYYFAYFNDIKSTFDQLVRIWKGQSGNGNGNGNGSDSIFSEGCISMSTTNSGSVSPSLSIADLYDADARPITIPALSSRLSTLTLESIPAEQTDNQYKDPSAIDVHDSSSSEDEESAVVGWLDGKRRSGMQLVYNLLGAKTGSAATVYKEDEQEQRQQQKKPAGNEKDEPKPNEEGDTQHRSAFPHQDPIEERTRMNFRKYFVLPETENLCAVYQCSLMKTLPCYGKLYISTNFVCFNSKGFATKTKVIIPFRDIVRIQKIRSRGYVFHTLSILTQNKKEIFIEFSSIVKRNSCFARLYLQHKWANEDTPSSKENEKEMLDWEARLLEDEQKVNSAYSTSMINAGLPVLSESHIELPAYKRPGTSLHFTCVTIGTRGDVQPYIALCKGLMKEGHRCRIATHDEFRKWIEGHGIEFRSIGGDPSELMRICVENNFFSVHFIMEGLRLFKHWIDELLTLTWQACQGTDVLIESPSAMVGVHMAEKLRIPYFRSFPMPMTRTRSFPHPFATPNNPKGRLYNDMTYVLFDHAVWRAIATRTNDFRRNILHLPPTTYEKLEIWKIPYLYCFSPNIVPSPLDWMDWIHCTGYWFLDNPDNGWIPSAELQAFIKAPDPRPLVYIGFGSIIVSDPKEITCIIVEAALASNVRAVISSGWASRLQKAKQDIEDEQDDILSRHPDTIFGVESVPHDWLFPQMRAVVHHGGAGTTAAGLRAGVPTIVKPFFADQFFWGERVEEMGIGICIKNLTVESLSAALRVVSTDEAMLKSAKLVGERIRKEDGVQTAIQCIYRDMELAKARTLSSAQRTASEQGVEDEDEWTLIDASASGSISPGSWRPTTGA